MAKYLTAPIEGAVLRDYFMVDEEPIDEVASSELAKEINNVVTEMGGYAVWFSRERDSKEARIHGAPVRIGGRVVRYASAGDELAIFPTPAQRDY